MDEVLQAEDERDETIDGGCGLIYKEKEKAKVTLISTRVVRDVGGFKLSHLTCLARLLGPISLYAALVK